MAWLVRWIVSTSFAGMAAEIGTGHVRAAESSPSASEAEAGALQRLSLTELLDLHSPAALYEVGYRYYAGQDVAKDISKSIEYFRSAAGLGHAQAMFSLGVIYQQGQSVPADDAEGFRWYLRSAEAGHLEGMCNAGLMYKRGQGVEQNYAEALKWLSLSATSGRPVTMTTIAYMHYHGLGTPVDYRLAMHWYRRAVDAGATRAVFCPMAVMYSLGKGVETNSAEAISLYQQAAEHGEIEGLYFIGLMYAEGVAVPADEAEARRWIQQAADRGYAGAIAWLRDHP
jgi:TPR repeat protein